MMYVQRVLLAIGLGAAAIFAVLAAIGRRDARLRNEGRVLVDLERKDAYIETSRRIDNADTSRGASDAANREWLRGVADKL